MYYSSFRLKSGAGCFESCNHMYFGHNLPIGTHFTTEVNPILLGNEPLGINFWFVEL